LLLSLITIVYEAELDLPDRRTELYRQCVDILLTKWDASRDIVRRREFKSEQKRQLMQEVAWHFHTVGQRYFSERELLKFVGDFLPTIGLSKEQNIEILKEITAENGLLKEQANGWYGFMHLTIQEYFVAQYLSIHNMIDKIFINRHEPWWEEVILLYAGLAPDASFLIKNLLDGDTRSPLKMNIRTKITNSDLLLAAKSLTARPTIKQVSLRQEVFVRLYTILLNTQRADLRQIVATSLVDIGGKETNDKLMSLLASPQTFLAVKQSLVYALMRQKKYFAAKILINLALDAKTDANLKNTILLYLESWSIHGIVSVLDEDEKDKVIHQFKALTKLAENLKLKP